MNLLEMCTQSPDCCSKMLYYALIGTAILMASVSVVKGQCSCKETNLEKLSDDEFNKMQSFLKDITPKVEAEIKRRKEEKDLKENGVIKPLNQDVFKDGYFLIAPKTLNNRNEATNACKKLGAGNLYEIGRDFEKLKSSMPEVAVGDLFWGSKKGYHICKFNPPVSGISLFANCFTWMKHTHKSRYVLCQGSSRLMKDTPCYKDKYCKEECINAKNENGEAKKVCGCKDAKKGYRLKYDKRTCANPCKERGNGICGSSTPGYGATCTNLDGHTFTCGCRFRNEISSGGKCISIESFITETVAALQVGNTAKFKKQVENIHYSLSAIETQCNKGTKQMCEVKDFIIQIKLLYGMSKQYVRHDGRILSTPEWKDIGLQKYLDELKDDLKQKANHIDIKKDLAAVQAATNKGFSAMSKYFQKLAHHDKKVADADVGFIRSELDRLKAGSSELFAELRSDLRIVLKDAIKLLGAEVAERVIDVALNVAQCFNPFAIVVGNCDAASIKDAVESLGDATKRLTKAVKLRELLDEILQKGAAVQQGFLQNERQNHVMMLLVQRIRSGRSSAEHDMNAFLDMYSAYTPALTNQDLTFFLTAFTTISEMGCGLKDSASGAVVNVAQTAMAAALKDPCDRLPAKMAKFASYQEELFQFQFDLVDSIAGYVRGSIAEDFAEEIEQKSKSSMDLVQLSVGLLIDMMRVQKVSVIYCNYLEYMNGGERPKTCKTEIFSEADLNLLVSHTVAKPDTALTTGTIPTTPTTKSGMAFIDLQRLANKKEISFQLPLNNPKWLVQNGWVMKESDANNALTVHKFEVYFPPLSKDPKCNMKIMMKLYSGETNPLFGSDKTVTYSLEKYQFRFIYNTDASQCTDSVQNPASSSQKICILSAGDFRNSDGLLPPPSLYTAPWTGKLTIRGDCEILSDEELKKIPSVKVKALVGSKSAKPDFCWPNPCKDNKKCTSGQFSYTCK